ncbi:MAG TPA: tRNA (5-methylaminomethyl-2-thiouridylate)-methyltransferase [Chryseolinea sp.]
MATVTSNYVEHTTTSMTKVNRATQVLRLTYGLVPIVAGLDKFMNVLTDWSKYLAPAVTDVIPLSPDAFMNIVGVIEIIAGIIVLARPKLGSIIVGLWLIGIAINLLLTGQYFDVAVRDIVMAIGAFCLYTLLDDGDANHRRNN